MTDVNLPQTNGSAHTISGREDLLERTRALAGVVSARRDELRAELAEVDNELRAYEKVIAALDPDAAPRRKPPEPAPKRPTPARVGPERLAEIEEAVRRIALDKGEVVQKDVSDATGYSSAVTSAAFGQLREANVIRIASRGPGTRKSYKLTRPAEREAAR